MAEERLRLSDRPSDMTVPKHAEPVSSEEFDHALRAFAPFEQAPHLAVAVSGGADSMALAMLSHHWVQQKNGRISALVVDHGLRRESADEAGATVERLRALGIDAQVLVWTGDKPAAGIQAAARRARYELLDAWCRKNGVLHLLVAHHADDQAETFMMRVRRGSGPDGLAAMSPVRELSACRLLRPLLAIPKSRLVATLQAEHVGWIEDPSNTDSKYARTGIRSELARMPHATGEFVIATQRFARARQALETETARWLAHHAALDPAGFLQCDHVALMDANAEIRLRVLSRAARCIGGKSYAPEITAVERLAGNIASGQGATLGGARFDLVGDVLDISREARNLPQTQALAAGVTHWDRRFAIFMPDGIDSASVQPWSAAIGEEWPKTVRPAWFRALPAKVRAGLPIVHIADRYEAPRPGGAENHGISVRFAPTMPLSGSGFTVA
jgi:tRNA(Ile)-lysidine synthase